MNDRARIIQRAWRNFKMRKLEEEKRLLKRNEKFSTMKKLSPIESTSKEDGMRSRSNSGGKRARDGHDLSQKIMTVTFDFYVFSENYDF